MCSPEATAATTAVAAPHPAVGRAKLLRQATRRYLDSTRDILREISKALREKKVLFFVPSMFQQGFSLSTTISVLPVLRGEFIFFILLLLYTEA